jgi:hypothetical protein
MFAFVGHAILGSDINIRTEGNRKERVRRCISHGEANELLIRSEESLVRQEKEKICESAGLRTSEGRRRLLREKPLFFGCINLSAE